ncbi:N-formylglutamate amidohydrolase [Tropicimonas sp. IMCC34011]|uniref:N-formylglutamate amidohydrolase n=1 Tax=Tropicimonas sp. IMCC34011 TaxID=2248759 RepID=UPI000E22A8E4|nr:N-formylglutamate amidohydrolase [Tropicimonas sp. IMCC34011]
MTQAPFRIERPTRATTATIFASPHSGRDYPPSFLRRVILDELSVRSSEDAFMDELVSAAPSCGATLIAANVPRAYIDLNRGPDELDPGVVQNVRGSGNNPRIGSGLGVIPRVVSNGRAIYSGKIELAEAKARIADFWQPYHAALAAEIESAKRAHGIAILFDMHSMPHEAIDAGLRAGGRPPQVVLGNRFGAACGGDIMQRIEAIFRKEGFRVALNVPFAGAYVTQQYGRPARNQHAVQIEIDRSLYMDEARIEKGPEFDAFRERMSGIVRKLADLGRPAQSVSLAAE